MKYLDEVRVTSGFYKGQTGIVIESGPFDPYSTRRYRVVLPGVVQHIAWIREAVLELADTPKPKPKPEPRFAVGDCVVLLKDLWRNAKGDIGTIRHVNDQGRYDLVIVNGPTTWVSNCSELNLARVIFYNDEERDKFLT